MKSYEKLSDPCEIITARRSELSMTQGELAKRLNYPSVNFISMLETKRSKVPLEKAVEFSSVLEMEPKWFIQKIMEDRFPSIAKILFH